MPTRSPTTCPECGQHTLRVLAPREVCEQCASEQAWDQLDRIVITHEAIDEAVARLEKGPPPPPLSTRLRLVWPIVLTTLAALASAAGAFVLLSARDVGPLDELLDTKQAAAILAMVAGLGAMAFGIVAHIRVARTSLYRSWLALVVTSLGMGGGVIAAALGLLGLPGDIGVDHLRMPARSGAPFATPEVTAIINATTVVIAPDADGDGSMPALGTGSIVAREPGRAWIVTCSHVAIPYKSVAAWRDVRETQPVWVELSDGRSGIGVVRWTARPPLDVALIELPIEHPPAPVPVAAASSGAGPDARVTFVPNPYRHGWLIHDGHVLKRVTHTTPAGEYSLLHTDLPVQPGDSGSGLFDAHGRLIGINTWARFGVFGGSQGISLPSEAMAAIVDLIRSGELHRLDEVVARTNPRGSR